MPRLSRSQLPPFSRGDVSGMIFTVIGAPAGPWQWPSAAGNSWIWLSGNGPWPANAPYYRKWSAKTRALGVTGQDSTESNHHSSRRPRDGPYPFCACVCFIDILESSTCGSAFILQWHSCMHSWQTPDHDNLSAGQEDEIVLGNLRVLMQFQNGWLALENLNSPRGWWLSLLHLADSYQRTGPLCYKSLVDVRLTKSLRKRYGGS